MRPVCGEDPPVADAAVPERGGTWTRSRNDPGLTSRQRWLRDSGGGPPSGPGRRGTVRTLRTCLACRWSSGRWAGRSLALRGPGYTGRRVLDVHVAVVRRCTDGTPRTGGYDYRRAALDAMHFPKLVDRFWQNLRRTAIGMAQYFAVVEEQRRLAPHLHAAVRGAIPRAVVREVAAATYHQVWCRASQDVHPEQHAAGLEAGTWVRRPVDGCGAADLGRGPRPAG